MHRDLQEEAGSRPHTQSLLEPGTATCGCPSRRALLSPLQSNRGWTSRVRAVAQPFPPAGACLGETRPDHSRTTRLTYEAGVFLRGKLWKGHFHFCKSPSTHKGHVRRREGGSQEYSLLGVWHKNLPLRHPTPSFSPFSGNDVTLSP